MSSTEPIIGGEAQKFAKTDAVQYAAGSATNHQWPSNIWKWTRMEFDTEFIDAPILTTIWLRKRLKIQIFVDDSVL